MIKFFQYIGRLSIRGYFVLGGLIAIAVLATYSNWHARTELAANQAQQQAAEHATTEELNLKSAETTEPSASDHASSSPANGETHVSPALPAPSSPVAAARVARSNLVFTPANITLSLGSKLPLVTISSPNGKAISAPIITSSNAGLQLTPVRDAPKDALPSWSMEISGKPALGVYHLDLQATSQTDNVTTIYTGTLTVLVIL